MIPPELAKSWTELYESYLRDSDLTNWKGEEEINKDDMKINFTYFGGGGGLCSFTTTLAELRQNALNEMS